MFVLGQRRIEGFSHGRNVSLLDQGPLLSSSRRWPGFLLEQHVEREVFEIPEHKHHTHVVHVHTGPPSEINWRTDGRAVVTRTVPGSSTILPIGNEHSVRTVRETSGDGLVMAIEQAFLERAVNDTTPGGRIEIEEHLDVRDPQITYIFQALRADVVDDSPAGNLYGETLGTALAVYMIRRYSVPGMGAANVQGGMPRARLNRVLEYIDENLDENISLADLANVAGMNLYHFSRLFKQSTGETPHQFVLQRRVDRAKALLNDPEMSVLEASARTGFDDQKHFSKVFRRMTGATPTAYRANR